MLSCMANYHHTPVTIWILPFGSPACGSLLLLFVPPWFSPLSTNAASRTQGEVLHGDLLLSLNRLEMSFLSFRLLKMFLNAPLNSLLMM